MPTPTDVFIEIAARYGGVNREDLLAVQRWYEHELERLPEETIDAILDELLCHEGASPAGQPPTCYPEDAPLPRIDASPRAAIPLAARVLSVLRRLASRGR